jgi:hypothetical protein
VGTSRSDDPSLYSGFPAGTASAELTEPPWENTVNHPDKASKTCGRNPAGISGSTRSFQVTPEFAHLLGKHLKATEGGAVESLDNLLARVAQLRRDSRCRNPERSRGINEPGSHGMIFMPWVRKKCEKPTACLRRQARERCRGYQLAGQKRAAGNSNHWNVKELENLSQCSHFSHFEG